MIVNILRCDLNGSGSEKNEGIFSDNHHAVYMLYVLWLIEC